MGEGVVTSEKVDANDLTAARGVGARESEDTARLKRRVTWASVSVAVTLIIVKIGAWLLTGSVSLLSSLIDSVTDATASIITMMAVRQALQPADAEHRFGHGKAEPLAALGQAAFICGSAVLLVIEAGSRLGDPPPVQNGEIGVAVMIFAILVTFALVAYQSYALRKTGSLAVKADRLHYAGDVLLNLSVMISIALATFGGVKLADPVIAIAIAGYLVFGAVKIGRNALDSLMDRELPEAERERIKRIVTSVPGVKGMHDLRTRTSSIHTFIQLHIELDSQMTLIDAHIISDKVEAALHKAYPRAEIITHQDPEGVKEYVAKFD